MAWSSNYTEAKALRLLHSIQDLALQYDMNWCLVEVLQVSALQPIGSAPNP